MSIDRETVLELGLVTSRTEKRAPRRFMGRIMSGPDAGTEFAVGSRALVVGAEKKCAVVIDDPKVSRRHVEVVVASGGVNVRDLGSKNGTFWNGAQISEAVVPAGASIKVGNSVIKFSTTRTPILPPSSRNGFGGLVGESVVMREIYAVLEAASGSEATILVQGESGTGKEVAARAIHDHSPRAGGPFVTADCSAIPEQLFESHFFGHQRGAFTGAVADRQGLLAEADGGTVFMDEVGELSLPSQAKLLRALEARKVRSVGAEREYAFDVRVVAATHRDLHTMVDEGTFRFDLFHRLAVVHLELPPLRDHPEDIPDLVRHFYRQRGVEPKGVDGDNMTALQRHNWRGNVRELRNCLERAWALSPDDGAVFSALPLWLAGGGTERAVGAAPMLDTSVPFKEAKEHWIEHFEKRYLAAVFAAHNGNVTRAAAQAGINRRHFRELLEKHQLR